MKIDWKYVATTPGYKSLKAAYTHDVTEAAKRRHPMRKKAEFLKLFTWVIGRAKHYAHHTGKPIEEILNDWEEQRDYWWLNFYQDCRQPKLHSNSKKPLSLKGEMAYYKKGWGRQSPRLRQQRLLAAKSRKAKELYGRAKPRWDNARKQRAAELRSL